MPPVVLLVAGLSLALGSGFAISAGLITSIAMLNTMIGMGLSMALSGGLGMLRGNQANPVSVSGGQLAVRQPVSFWRVIYGTFQGAGVLSFVDFPATSDNSHQYLHLVYTISCHQITKFVAVAIDGIIYNIGSDPTIDQLVLQGDGYYRVPVQQSAALYYEHIAFEFDVGDPANAAQPFPNLNSESTKWNGSCLQRGRAKIHVRLRYSSSDPQPNVFVGGRIPNLEFKVVGKPILDTRTGGAESDVVSITIASGLVTVGVVNGAIFSPGDNVAASIHYDAGINSFLLHGNFVLGTVVGNIVTWHMVGVGDAVGTNVSGSLTTLASPASNPSNPALVVYDYLTDSDYGMAVDPAEIDISTVNAAANACEYNVIIIWNDSGFVPEDTFLCDGMFDCSSPRGNVLAALLNSMGGWAVPPGDLWRVFAGVFVYPTIELTDADLRDSIKGDFRISRRDICNGVKGTFLPKFLPTNGTNVTPPAWQWTDFPPFQNADYVAEDGDIIWKDITLDFTTSLWAAQRLAKLTMERLRRQVTINLPCKLSAYQVQAGDNVYLTHPRWGYNQKIFQVIQVSLVHATTNGAGAEQGPALGVDLVLRETDVYVYAFLGPNGPGDFGEYSTYGVTGVEDPPL